MFYKRGLDIAKHYGASMSSFDNIEALNLRGRRLQRQFLRELGASIEPGRYSLIIIDAIYKLLAGKNESDTGDITELLNQCEALAELTGSAVVASHHFSKGNQAAKEAIDRASGTGVWGRDPDAILPITAHDQKDCYVVEPILRDFAPVAPFGFRFNFPVFELDPSLDPANLKQKRGNQFAQKYVVKDLLKHITVLEKLRTKEFKQRVRDETGMSEATFYRLLDQAKNSGQLIQESVTNLWKLP